MSVKGRIENWLVRRLTKVGGRSYSVTLPVDVVRRFGWKEHQKLKLTVDNDHKRVIIKDWRKSKR